MIQLTVMSGDSLKAQLSSAEAKVIRNTLRRFGGDVTQTAAELQISTHSLYARCKRLKIKPSAYKPENIEAAKQVLELEEEEGGVDEN